MVDCFSTRDFSHQDEIKIKSYKRSKLGYHIEVVNIHDHATTRKLVASHVRSVAHGVRVTKQHILSRMVSPNVTNTVGKKYLFMFVAYGRCLSATNQYIYLFIHFFHCFNSLSRTKKRSKVNLCATHAYKHFF